MFCVALEGFDLFLLLFFLYPRGAAFEIKPELPALDRHGTFTAQTRRVLLAFYADVAGMHVVAPLACSAQ